MSIAKIFSAILFIAAFSIGNAQAETSSLSSYYKYANTEAEYSVMLPEAPSVETIWADEGNVPYLDHPPRDGAIGEVANFKRMDMETEDSYTVKITFLQADKDFLAGLDEEKMKSVLKNEYQGPPLTSPKFAFSAGTPPLKWATLTGFSVGKNNQALFHAAHYLTGQQSIMVIDITYNVENKTFQDYYQALIDNITYRKP